MVAAAGRSAWCLEGTAKLWLSDSPRSLAVALLNVMPQRNLNIHMYLHRHTVPFLCYLFGYV